MKRVFGLLVRRREAIPALVAVLLLGLAAIGVSFWAPVAQADQPSAAGDTKVYVGQKTCMGCHQQEASNWAHTIQATDHMRHCSRFVSIGRVRWIAETPYDGKDDSGWYRFEAEPVTTIFTGRAESPADMVAAPDSAIAGAGT